MTTRIQRSFAGGVLSPALRSRVDLSKFQSGLAEGKNVFIQRYGGVANRPGTTLVRNYGNKPKRLISFERSSGNSLVVLLGDKVLEVYGAAGGTKATPWSADEIWDVRYVQSADVMTFVHPDHPTMDLRVAPNLQWDIVRTRREPNIQPPEHLTINRAGSQSARKDRKEDYAITSIDRNTYEESFPITNTKPPFKAADPTADNPIELTWPLVNNAVEYNIYKRVNNIYYLLGVSRNNLFEDIGQSTDSSITPPDYFGGQDRPFDFSIFHITQATSAVVRIKIPFNIDPSNLGLDVVLKGRKIRITAPNDANSEYRGDYTIISATTENLPVLPVFQGTLGEGTDADLTIDMDSSGFGAFVAFTRDIGDLTPQLVGVESGTIESLDDKPSVIAYYQQRLCLGASKNNPEQIQTSKTGQFKNFTSGRIPAADDSVNFRMAGSKVSKIVHLVTLSKLVVLTNNAEWIISGDEAGILTPESVNPRWQSGHGSSRLRPLELEKSALYTEPTGEIVRDLAYNYEVDGYRGNDLTIFSSHFFEGRKIVDWAYQQAPHSLVWAVRDDGVLLSLTYLKDQEILAWCEHEIRGARVLSIASGNRKNEDFIYLFVEQDGVYRLLELNRRSPGVVDEIRSNFLDFSSSWDSDIADGGSLVQSSDGINFVLPGHLRGIDVAVVADGGVVANPLNPSYKKVRSDSDGNVKLGREYKKVVFGLPYISDIETLDVEDPGDGTYAGKEINIQNVVLYVDRSRGIFVGGRKPKGDDLLDGLVEHKTGSDEGEDVYDSPKRLQTGEIDINIESEWNSNGRVFIRQIDPLPLSISAIAPSGLFPDGRD